MLEHFLINIDQYIIFRRVKLTQPYVTFHLHNGCEIFYLISGAVEYFVEKSVYPLDNQTVIITNNYELHKPAFVSPVDYERVTIQFDPALVRAFQYPELDLLGNFYNRNKGENNKIFISKEALSRLNELFNRYEKIQTQKGTDVPLLKLTSFLEILILLNNASCQKFESGLIPAALIPIMDYIDKNLDSDLSLDTLEKQFFISKFYLSRLFKKHIGSTIHDYIIFKRVSRAKELISRGMKTSSACSMSGFNDYSNFVKIFKKITGIMPSSFK